MNRRANAARGERLASEITNMLIQIHGYSNFSGLSDDELMAEYDDFAFDLRQRRDRWATLSASEQADIFASYDDLHAEGRLLGDETYYEQWSARTAR